MRQLLKELGASEEQIKRVLATAEQNRKKPVSYSPPSYAQMGAMPGAPGGPEAGGAPGAPEAQGGADAGGRKRGEGKRGGGDGASRGDRASKGGSSGMSDEDRKKMRDALQKALNGRNMQDLSAEERQKIMAQVQKAVPGAKQTASAGGPPQILGRGPVSLPSLSQFSAKDLENAKLPPAPEEDSQMDVLIRPGLLTDVEIIVEKLSNAIHIPSQAVFEKNGKLIAYVQQGPGKWEERQIKPLKRSESTTVISEGLKAGETIAMSDPYEKPGDKKKKQEKSSQGGGGNPMGGMPSGGKGGK
jgi:hypothetical protein